MFVQILLTAFLFTVLLLGYLYFRAQSFKATQPQLCIILGSGGHTTQMCEILRKFHFEKVQKITLIIGTSDHLSQAFFTSYFKQLSKSSNFIILKTNRTNAVKQSKITSVFTTLYALLTALYLICKNLLGTTHLISNGPGICVPFYFLFWIFNKLYITNVKTIFIQSWCRVQSISTTGKIVKYFTDQFLVHWENQVKLAKGIKYMGKII